MPASVTSLNFTDTIAAISTPTATGGIGIVRLSGDKSVDIADKIFISKLGKKVKDQKSWTMSLGDIVDNNGDAIDEVILSVMLSPRSYTGEDVCEINCHGGLIVCDTVLRLCIENGARMAEPGEFTKRAFLNGRIDLTQAEAVIDVITAPTENALSVAAAQLNKAMQKKIFSVRQRLINLTADILVAVEYPEEDTEYAKEDEVLNTLGSIKEDINILYTSFQSGKAIKEGIRCVICGKPNAGKSSLLNLLAGYDRAIVTSIEGTTRDVIEEKVSFGKVILNLADTAGIRQTKDEIEVMGIERSRDYIESAELILLVLDGNVPLDKNDYDLMELCKDKRTIAVVNKIDLPQRLNRQEIADNFSNIVNLSSKTGEGMEQLRKTVELMFINEGIAPKGELVTNPRQRESLYRSLESVNIAIEGLKSGFTADLVTGDINDAADYLGEITGQTASEDTIDNIFSRFCIGK